MIACFFSSNKSEGILDSNVSKSALALLNFSRPSILNIPSFSFQREISIIDFNALAFFEYPFTI